MSGMQPDRRRFLRHTLTAGALAATGFGYPLKKATAADKTEVVEVDTLRGRLRGQRQGGVVSFKGVEYAGPVSGKNRFKAPPPLEPWTGVRNALSFGPHAWQPKTDFFKLASEVDENCLVLNVWTPEVRGSQRRPVMVYLHGGGYGAGSGEVVDGSSVAETQDVVVVSVNHRLGLLGFLYLGDIGGEEYATSGNQSSLDMVAALQWIHDNIESFGGDPGRVMIFGESGGGGKVATLYTMPAAHGLFHRASIESAPATYLTKRSDATATTRAVLGELSIRPDQLYKLEQVPAARFLEVADKITGGSTDSSEDSSPVGYFGPVVDGHYVTQHPFDPVAAPVSASVPLLLGANHDETIFFLSLSKNPSAFTLDEAGLRARVEREFPKRAKRLLQVYRQSRPGVSPSDLYIAITTASMVWNPMDLIAERKAAQGGAPIYRYLFSYPSDAKLPGIDYPMKAMHSMEIDFKFNTAAHSPRTGTRPERLVAARNMSEMWATFARTGHPGARGQPEWPAFTSDKRMTMIIDTKCRVESDPYGDERRVWLEPV